MEDKLDIISIGESLVELSAEDNLCNAEYLYKYYGGDALATAVAAVRLGSKVGFVTKLGNDAFKNFLLDAWKSEGLDISQVTMSEDRNGLYLIARPCHQQKEFAFYRKKTAPARLSVEDISKDYIQNAKVVYSTGVTQSLSLSAREVVRYCFDVAKQAKILSAYDPNFNPNVFSIDDAREYFDQVIPSVDVLFMSARHDLPILAIESVDAAIKFLWDKGVSIVVIKSAADKGYFIGYNGSILFTDFYTDDVCDTTCSGDAFNGGFLHAITHGCSPFEAAKLASIVAGLQAKAVGAIKSIPFRDEVYPLFERS